MPNMKIQIASDLHLEGRKGYMPERAAFDPVPSRDLLVLAGDIGTHLLAREFVLRELEISPVIYVPGNHEYYTPRSRSEVDRDWTTLAASEPDLHYLIAEGVTIDGVRFWGAPWYSDLWGATDPWDLATVRNGIMDFWAPVNGDGEWTLSRHINHHLAQTELLAAQAGKVEVIITHWPPTKGAIHPKFEGDKLNPYFYNDREDLVQAIGARLWVSGHTHEAYDYDVGSTRCVGNPAGYLGEPRISAVFKPDKVIEF